MSISKFALLFSLALIAVTVAKADFIIYSGQGQSDEQMDRDKL